MYLVIIMYLVEKNINKLNNFGNTFFLDPKELKEVTDHLKKNTYNIYKPYIDSERNIIYKNDVPSVILYEIISKKELRHQDILGSIYALNLDISLFGDIVIKNDRYFIYVLSHIRNTFENDFKKVGNTNIELKELDISYLEDYTHDYEEIELIVTSLRLDTIIARLIHTNRDSIKDLIKDKMIIYNYELLKNYSKTINENDTFSIRKIGKFKYVGIIKNTKSDNYIIKVLKYK
jgi:RNA-binding protein YlmH